MQVKARGLDRTALRGGLLLTTLALLGATGLRAQPCIPTPLLGLPGSVRAGERVRVTAELTTDCNYKVVDEATLVCRYGDGREDRYDLTLFPRRDHTQAEVVFELPNVATALSGQCFIEFTQCKRTVRTCASELTILGAEQVETPAVPPVQSPLPTAPGRRRPEARPAPEPVRKRRLEPRPAPEPARLPPQPAPPRAGGGGGTFFKSLGWIGVAGGIAAYADASTKEEEGLTEDAQDSEELGNQILVASGVLLLLGYGIDGTGFVSDGDPPPLRGFRPMLALDPVNRGVYVQVSFTFD